MSALDDFDLVIFDCDGVLVDSEVLACNCLGDAFRAQGVSLTLEEVVDRFVGRSTDAVVAYWRTVQGRDMPVDFFADYRQRIKAAFAERLTVMPLAEEVLARLPLPFCLASSSEPERIRLTLSVTHLDDHFGDRVFNTAMVDKDKPAPDLFLFAARELNQRPERTLVVEDSVSGVRAGKAAAMTVWGFVGGSHCRGRDVGAQLSAAGADRIFDSLAELLPR